MKWSEVVWKRVEWCGNEWSGVVWKEVEWSGMK